jgi:predicted secreted Zn-dependent protease
MTVSEALKTDGVTREALAQVRWHISSKSENGGGSCVEAGPFNDGTGRVAVRHSHHRESGPVVVYTRAEWDAFIAGVKHNEFDFRV